MQSQSVFLAKRQDFPQRDGGKPQLVLGILQCGRQADGKTRPIERAPQPDVGIDQQLHPRSASQSSSSLAGETMSPLICPVPARAPPHASSSSDACGGTTSATGSPKRVTRTVFPLLRTFSSTARQALNLEIAISSMSIPLCR